MAPRQDISGLPETSGDQDYYRYNDVHMDTARGTIGGLPDIRMDTAKGYTIANDISMDTTRGNNTTLKVGPLKAWERELVDNPEVKRKATVAQLCACLYKSFSHIFPPSIPRAPFVDCRWLVIDFLDYYFQLLGYIASRNERRAKFDSDTASRKLSAAEHTKEFKSYCGRERVLLRRRRTKLRVEQFHIIAQVGQGGYGEVYLARKQETGEVCALKKMRKRTLFKMDEVRTGQLNQCSLHSRSWCRFDTFSLSGIS